MSEQQKDATPGLLVPLPSLLTVKHYMPVSVAMSSIYPHLEAVVSRDSVLVVALSSLA
jgi:hypothetical protein